MTDKPLSREDKLREEIKRVRIQRNNYEVLLREAESKLAEFKTPVYTTAHGHLFKRYLMENEFAEEMKCECGYTIYPCKNEEQVTAAMMLIEGKISVCKHYPKKQTIHR